jgi:hypothetical protein
MRFALRETRQVFNRPTVLVALVAAIVILGLSGPFGTLQMMRLGPRLAYWAVVAAATFATGAFVAAALNRALHGRQTAPWLIPAMIGLATGVAVTVVVLVINYLTFGVTPAEPGYFWGLATNVLGIAAVIAVVMQVTSPIGVSTVAPAEDARPPILDRLDLAKRGSLVSLSMQDHYVEVVTTKGAALVLLRLGDAIREVGDTEGLQVHRSHWVATRHVKAARRAGDRAILTMHLRQGCQGGGIDVNPSAWSNGRSNPPPSPTSTPSRRWRRAPMRSRAARRMSWSGCWNTRRSTPPEPVRGLPT